MADYNKVADQFEQEGYDERVIEIDPENVHVIKKRLEMHRDADNVFKFRDYYRFTPNLDSIWPVMEKNGK